MYKSKVIGEFQLDRPAVSPLLNGFTHVSLHVFTLIYVRTFVSLPAYTFAQKIYYCNILLPKVGKSGASLKVCQSGKFNVF